jgi:hypothetical protein
MSVIWKNGNRLDYSCLQYIEAEWKISFPEDFKNVILMANEGYPTPYVFDTSKTIERVFGGLLNFDQTTKGGAIEIYSFIKDRLPDKVFPFAQDPFGNFICFDFGSDEKMPSVIFWNHEGWVIDGKDTYEIEFVAPSFSDLLNKLYENPLLDKESDFTGFEILD